MKGLDKSVVQRDLLLCRGGGGLLGVKSETDTSWLSSGCLSGFNLLGFYSVYNVEVSS